MLRKFLNRSQNSQLSQAQFWGQFGRGFYDRTVQDNFVLYLSAGCTDFSGHSILHLAAQYGHSEVLELLLDVLPDLDVNAVTIYGTGSTPLLLAIKRGQSDAVRVLLGVSNVNTNIADHSGLLACLRFCVSS